VGLRLKDRGLEFQLCEVTSGQAWFKSS